jgi:hypothetical protein
MRYEFPKPHNSFCLIASLTSYGQREKHSRFLNIETSQFGEEELVIIV